MFSILSNVKEIAMALNVLNLPTLWEPGEYDVYKDRSLRRPKKRFNTPKLESVLDYFGAFPPYSLVIGMCTDGMPFMLDLGNPKTGSILVAGDSGCGKTTLLRTMGISACNLNHPENVSIYIISGQIKEYADFRALPHCETMLNSYDRAAGELVIELASINEQRRAGRERGEKIILILDEISSFEGMLRDYSVYLNLKTLISRGPANGIWPMIAINANEARERRSQLLRSFGTYIFEKTGTAPLMGTDDDFIPTGEANLQANFEVILGGRLVPISSLYA
jgi:hypothetical protein